MTKKTELKNLIKERDELEDSIGYLNGLCYAVAVIAIASFSTLFMDLAWYTHIAIFIPIVSSIIYCVYVCRELDREKVILNYKISIKKEK